MIVVARTGIIIVSKQKKKKIEQGREIIELAGNHAPRHANPTGPVVVVFDSAVETVLYIYPPIYQYPNNFCWCSFVYVVC